MAKRPIFVFEGNGRKKRKCVHAKSKLLHLKIVRTIQNYIIDKDDEKYIIIISVS